MTIATQGNRQVLDVPPPSTAQNVGDSGWRNSKASGNLAATYVTERAYSMNLPLGQFCHAMPRTAVVISDANTSFPFHIGHVVGVRADPEMIRVDAERLIASMQDAPPVISVSPTRNWPSERKIRGPMGLERLPIHANHAICIRWIAAPSRLPNPAAGAFVFPTHGADAKRERNATQHALSISSNVALDKEMWSLT